VPPLLALEACEAEELAFAAEKPLLPERALLPPLELAAPPRLKAKPECGADGGGTERAAVEKLRAGAVVGRALRFVRRVVDVEAGAFIAPTRALVAAVALELTKRREAAS
jgi:hypothetical protein